MVMEDRARRWMSDEREERVRIKKSKGWRSLKREEGGQEMATGGVLTPAGGHTVILSQEYGVGLKKRLWDIASKDTL